MSLKVGKTRVRSAIKIALFATYNMFYAFYMGGYLSRNTYLVAMGIFCFVCMIDYYWHKQLHIGLKDIKPMIAFIIVLSAITIFIQIINLSFNATQWSYMIYWILPLIAAYYWFNTTTEKERNIYFYIFLVRFLLTFVLNFGANFNIANLLSISWSDTMSSAFESSDAHNFLFMTMVFLYMDKRILAYVSAFFCLISFKRLSFILAILLLLFYRRIPKGSVPRKLNYTIIVAFCITPLLISWLLTPEANNLFMSHGIDIDYFTSYRLRMTRQIAEGITTYNGFGTMNTYMGAHPYGVYHLIYIMHFDYYMIFRECTIIAVIIFTYNFLKSASKEWKVYLMALYICLEMVASTFFMSIASWTIFYMFEFVVYSNCMPGKDNNNYESHQIITQRRKGIST